MLNFEKYQAKPPATVPFTENTFEKQDNTTVCWLGAAGVFMNCRGTTIMMDPILTAWPGDESRSEMGGLPLLAPPPIWAHQVKKLDAILYTHADDDHMGIATAKALLPSGAVFHTTACASEILLENGIPKERICVHKRHDVFRIGEVTVKMTGAFHPHQIGDPAANGYRYFTGDDCTGFRLETPDGVLWNPGDTMLMEEHLSNTDADIVMADFSDNEHHFGKTVAIQLMNMLRDSELIMYHWGTVYLPDHGCFNADPEEIRPQIIKPRRLHVLAPGEMMAL